jgi:hypothetical protein
MMYCSSLLLLYTLLLYLFSPQNKQQPYSNHNGGTLLFAPTAASAGTDTATAVTAAAAAYYDLYIPTGDGGAGNDPMHNAQNLTSLLGKVLRIRLSTAADAQGYTTPPDNPYAASSGTSHLRRVTLCSLCSVYSYVFVNPL